MIRRFISTVALIGCAAVYAYAAAAPERATFILTSGERKAGPVVFHGSDRGNLINGYLNLGVDSGGPEMTFPIDHVAVIDFVGGRPANAELDAVGSGHAIALRNGTVEHGRFVNVIGGDTVKWQDANGNTRDIPVSQVSRIYLNPTSALTAYEYTRRNSTAVGTTGTQYDQQGGIHVVANQPWSSTGLKVRRGDMVTFRTSGTVTFRADASQVAGADGNDAVRNPAFPVPAMPVGGLIGRIGNGAPFSIGSNTQPIRMGENGMLMIGVNDNDYSDNGGFFSVVVTKQ